VCLLLGRQKEFLDPEQGNHSVFDYTRHFNTVAQYGSHHVDTDEMKANLYRNGHTIELQDHLVLSPNLSYNYLVSASIDQERMMKAIAMADENKRKRVMPGSSVRGGSSGVPPKYHMVHTPHRGQQR
jgi:hypothetical protein